MDRIDQSDLFLPSEEIIMAQARISDRERRLARRRLAEHAPRGMMLPEGDSQAVLDNIKYYQAPVVLPGGSVGVRLHFARMGESDSHWDVPGSVSLYKCGAVFMLRSYEDPTVSTLRLSFDGVIVRRVRNAVSSRILELRNVANIKGVRLA